MIRLLLPGDSTLSRQVFQEPLPEKPHPLPAADRPDLASPRVVLQRAQRIGAAQELDRLSES